jgi:hypothetical protein
MVMALSLKRERSYVLEADQTAAAGNPKHVSTTWHYRRLTAGEAWTLRDEALTAVTKDGEQHMHFKGGARQHFILHRCLLRVEHLEDSDKPGKMVTYPGSDTSDEVKAQFFDRIPIEWLAELADAIHEASEVGDSLAGESSASPSLSLATSEAASTPSA